MASSDRISPAITGRDRVLVALYRLELSILPHVSCDAELHRRLRKMGELRQGLPVDVQVALIAEYISVRGSQS